MIGSPSSTQMPSPPIRAKVVVHPEWFKVTPESSMMPSRTDTTTSAATNKSGWKRMEASRLVTLSTALPL